MEKTTNELYKKLTKAEDALPDKAVERTKKEITRKGYDTTGYQYQFLVNILNEVVGLGNWGYSYQILKEIEGTFRNGKTYWDVTVDVKVWIKHNDQTTSFSCAGGHRAEIYADALKGAITNGFKKTLAFFGLGRRAYEGTIDEDYRPIPQTEALSTATLKKELAKITDTKKLESRFRELAPSLTKEQILLFSKRKSELTTNNQKNA